MGNLRTDFKDDIFQGNRKYIQVKNDDGTVSFVDATQYEQEGDYFGSTDVNATNAKVNDNEAAIAGKAASVHDHTKSQIKDFPSSMPASDVYAWAKQASKPTYNASEVGALPANGKAVSAVTADSATNASYAANSDKVDGLHFVVSTTAPTVDDKSIITFVI